MNSNQTIIDIKNLEKTYGSGSSTIKVLRGINLEIAGGRSSLLPDPAEQGSLHFLISWVVWIISTAGLSQ